MSAADLPDVDRIVAIDDPVARNRAITRAYRDLSRAMCELLGERDANWLTFGMWASATAGRFIRGDAVPVRWGVTAVAEGNRAIIADIGPRFCRFVRLARQSSPGSLGPAVGVDPTLTVTAELAEAFDCYAQVATDSDLDDGQRAEVMLRANVLVAHHEQRLADPWVDRALPLSGPVGILGTRLVTLRIPDGDLGVSRDVPRPAYLGGRRWPAVLEQLRDERLRRLFERYGQEDDGSASNVLSWEDLHDRMGYIACFFRAYQRDPALFDIPDEVIDGTG